MKNEADIMMKLVLVDGDEEIAKIEKYRKRKFEPFNAYIELDKSRDSAAGIKIPIVFDKERQQMRQADVIREIRETAPKPKPAEAPVDDSWLDFGKEVQK